MTNSTSAAAPAALPPDAQILQFATGAFISQAIYVAAKLGIADILKKGPRTAEYLAVATSTNEQALYRVLRAVASVGVFNETETGTFENSPMSDTLREDHPHSTRDLTIWINEEEHWRVYGHMMYSVKTGKPAFDHVYGQPVFDYLLHTNPELGAIFNRAMTSLSHLSIEPVLEAYDFSGAKVIADIAGGFGHLLGAIMQKYPAAEGILFEVPEVLEGAPAMMKRHGVEDRVSMVPGDFLEAIPVVADIYILKHIIHDWYDETNLKILGNIRANMPDEGKLMIIDAVLPDGNSPSMGKVIDLEMLMLPGGMERTAEQFDKLLTNAGFRLTRIIPTRGPMSIVEAVKAA